MADLDERFMRDFEQLKRRVGRLEALDSDLGADDDVDKLNVNTTGAATGEIKTSGAVIVGGQLTAASLRNGTWTPAFVGTTIGGTITYTNREGIYRRIGDLVYVEARLQVSALTVAPTGNLTITGLPFAAAAAQPNGSVSFGFVSQLNLSAGNIQLTGRIAPGDSLITLNEVLDDAAAGVLPAGALKASTNLIFSAWYRTDAA